MSVKAGLAAWDYEFENDGRDTAIFFLIVYSKRPSSNLKLRSTKIESLEVLYSEMQTLWFFWS